MFFVNAICSWEIPKFIITRSFRFGFFDWVWQVWPRHRTAQHFFNFFILQSAWKYSFFNVFIMKFSFLSFATRAFAENGERSHEYDIETIDGTCLAPGFYKKYYRWILSKKKQFFSTYSLLKIALFQNLFVLIWLLT